MRDQLLHTLIREHDGTLYDCLITIADYRDCTLVQLVDYTNAVTLADLVAWFKAYLVEHYNMFPEVRGLYLEGYLNQHKCSGMWCMEHHPKQLT